MTLAQIFDAMSAKPLSVSRREVDNPLGAAAFRDAYVDRRERWVNRVIYGDQ